MTAPIPEEEEQRPLGDAVPPGEHAGELPDEDDAAGGSSAQVENAESSEDQPSQ
ncbi:hypothetical protein [Nocardioides panaciterrulae]|uniref:Uncharacterized protein n=1 Tax=Nocardioides panaciterrulae TaxID=661492 RepID=A0A7Y9E957_9ACTN|nr:hypothetical protein [Nocardioides panaciterrulae]NYD43292.1 hypothetical protein [Nocardioides panaciterrulae]